MNTENLLAFWAKAIPDLQRHPDDCAALAANRHAFALDTLVGPWMGPIATAPVVLLTLNGGLSATGVEAREALTPEARANTARNLAGHAPLPDFATNPGGRSWTEGRLRQFGLTYADKARVTFVNLMPYRSREGAQDKHMTGKLASVRAIRSWARETLFPEARNGKRVVVCLRSVRDWMLTPDTREGEALFAPRVTRSGFIFREDRAAIVAAVRAAVR
jgi:hypothetical protein